jgi:hypothetical protein
MSISIHTPSMIKVDTSTLDKPAISNNKLSVRPNAQSLGATVPQASLRADDTQGVGNAAITPEAALGQLFDMLEGIFKAMRDLFSGKTAIKPDSGKLPVKPDAAKELVKPDAGRLPVLPDTKKELVKPNAGKLPVLPDTKKELVKPDAGKLPVLPDTNKELVKPDAGMLPVLPQPGDSPVIVPDRNKPHPVPSLPTVPKPASVNNDPKSNVQVNVVVNCHCPDGKVTPDRLPAQKVSTDARPQPPVLPDVKPQLPVLPGNFPRPNVPLDIAPQPMVLPDNMPTPSPDGPTPDLTSPGPVDDRSAGRHGRFNHRLSSRF